MAGLTVVPQVLLYLEIVDKGFEGLLDLPLLEVQRLDHAFSIFDKTFSKLPNDKADALLDVLEELANHELRSRYLLPFYQKAREIIEIPYSVKS